MRFQSSIHSLFEKGKDTRRGKFLGDIQATTKLVHSSRRRGGNILTLFLSSSSIILSIFLFFLFFFFSRNPPFPFIFFVGMAATNWILHSNNGNLFFLRFSCQFLSFSLSIRISFSSYSYSPPFSKVKSYLNDVISEPDYVCFVWESI
uniref:Transmembrane protein n=1 Tax=Nelumbo nucifera TaxID=4432 RepID=A0A822XWX7_NELNU|nr:TPA_asm: hypothetical protein HUJ06_026284 [Nelumbo nucifera]